MIANANAIVKHVIQIKNGKIKHVNMNVKFMVSAKRLQLELQHMHLNRYLNDIADASVIVSHM